jgi:hypothetical protein
MRLERSAFLAVDVFVDLNADEHAQDAENSEDDQKYRVTP